MTPFVFGSFISFVFIIIATVPRFSVGENMATHWGQTADWVSMVEGWYTGEESGITTNLINSSE